VELLWPVCQTGYLGINLPWSSVGRMPSKMETLLWHCIICFLPYVYRHCCEKTEITAVFSGYKVPSVTGTWQQGLHFWSVPDGSGPLQNCSNATGKPFRYPGICEVVRIWNEYHITLWHVCWGLHLFGVWSMKPTLFKTADHWYNLNVIQFIV